MTPINTMEEAEAQKKQFTGIVCRKDKKGMFVYSMQLVDGDEEILRTSGRQYASAFFYFRAVTGGNKKGLKRHFTFGKAPDRYSREFLAGTYPINPSD